MNFHKVEREWLSLKGCTMSTGNEDIGFQLLYAPVRRVERSRAYRRDCYEVALQYISSGCYAFLTKMIPNKSQNIQQLISTVVKEEYNLTPLSVYAVTTLSDNTSFSTDLCINIFYVIPTVEGMRPSQRDVVFISMSELMESPQLLVNHHPLIMVLDQWLYERHAIPSINPDLLFTSDFNGHSLVGTIQDVLDNPLRKTDVQPPEDALVIGLNNPIFPISNTN